MMPDSIFTQGGLARSVGADEPDDFALIDLEGRSCDRHLVDPVTPEQ